MALNDDELGISAFHLNQILADHDISCLEAYNNVLLAGLANGTLLLLTKQQQQWTLTQTIRNFNGTHISQLQITRHGTMLLCLGKDGLNAHALPSLSLKAQAAHTHNASSFAWNESTSTLVVAMKKKRVMYVFHYDGLEFVQQQKEIYLPQYPVKRIVLVVPSSNNINTSIIAYVAAGKEWMAVDISTGTIISTIGPISSIGEGSSNTIEAVSCTTTMMPCGVVATIGGSTERALLVSGNEVLIMSQQQQQQAGNNSSRSSSTMGTTTAIVVPKPIISSRVKFSCLIKAVVYSEPYIVAIIALQDGRCVVEVRSVPSLLPLPRPICQTILCPIINEQGEEGPGLEVVVQFNGLAPTTASDGSVFLSTTTTTNNDKNKSSSSSNIVSLVPVPLLKQAEMLSNETGDHEAALTMCRFASSSSSTSSVSRGEEEKERKKLEDTLRLALGRQLQDEGKIEESLLHLGSTSLAGPVDLLRPFPWLTPRRLLRQVVVAVGEEEEEDGNSEGEEEEEEDGDDGESRKEHLLTALLPYLMSQRSRLLSTAALGEDGQEKEEKEGGNNNNNNTSQQQHPSSPQPASLTIHQHHHHHPSTPLSKAAHLAQSHLGSNNPLATLLDTAIFLCLLHLPDSGTLLKFVKRPNWVDFQVAEDTLLLERGRYAEWIGLLQSRGRMEEALELLKKLVVSFGSDDNKKEEDRDRGGGNELEIPPTGAAVELTGLPGVWAAVECLKKLIFNTNTNDNDNNSSNSPRQLIDSHADWIVDADPDAGLDLCMDIVPPLEPSDIIPILERHDNNNSSSSSSNMLSSSSRSMLAAAFLEGMVESGRADPAEYHSELARLYLDRLLSHYQRKQQQDRKQDMMHNNNEMVSNVEEGCKEKLKHLILNSEHIDHAVLLDRLPATDAHHDDNQSLIELRAVLLECLGDHSTALKLLVHTLHQPVAAEQYADRVYQRRVMKRRKKREERKRKEEDGEAAGSGGGMNEKATSTVKTEKNKQSKGASKRLQFTNNNTNNKQEDDDDDDEEGEEDYDIYLQLFEVLLIEAGNCTTTTRSRSSSSSSSNDDDDDDDDNSGDVWRQLAAILSRKRTKIPALQSLHLIPGETHLTSALSYLTSIITGSNEDKRRLAVVQSLRRAEHIKLMGELSKARQRSVLVTPERACSLCYKRLGTSALVVQPHGGLVHLSCHKKEHM